ncbi:cyclin dependent kinase inhibitor 2A [Phyllostomus discolor]|uniref:Cyclin dependent kinase inhibitor 2A n=1 Tax=Phyllostomus discolor TaxID=89673 RepID=A0A6J2L506_9CHIR|nr:cyclin-dependent kinase inhibitor 2A isoform X3 [Phyllostomus discolor]KAF6123581.1 cyclin dependent kinase inhibitor 2A [Phyllostomus discolor]
MVNYTFLVTVRIRRVSGPPRVRAFVVQIPRPEDEGAAPPPALRAAAALVLALVRSQRRARQPNPGRPGHDDGQHSRGEAAAAPRRGPQLRGPRHSRDAGARRRPGGLPGHAGGAAPSRGAAGRARRLGSPARGPG